MACTGVSFFCQLRCRVPGCRSSVSRGAVYRGVVLQSVAVPCIDSCEASGRAGLPPAPHHPIFARPDTRHHAFKDSWLKANPAFGRADISGCSDAVRGSRPLTAAILNRPAAGLGDWLPRSPRSGLAAHASLRSSAAFYASTLNETVARLGGVVTGKRVAARQRNAATGSGRWRTWAAA